MSQTMAGKGPVTPDKSEKMGVLTPQPSLPRPKTVPRPLARSGGGGNFCRVDIRGCDNTAADTINVEAIHFTKVSNVIKTERGVGGMGEALLSNLAHKGHTILAHKWLIT